MLREPKCGAVPSKHDGVGSVRQRGEGAARGYSFIIE
jgi:hypothetical protein